MYVGNGRIGKFDSINVQLDLTALGEYIKGDAASKVKEWTDKQGKVHKTINLVVAPMKEENQTEYKTHSVKIDTWKPDKNRESNDQHF